MNTSALEDIQQALNAIRGDIKHADAETKLAALELIIGTSQSVVAMARKLTTPKVRTRTVIVPKEKVIKAEPRQRSISSKRVMPINRISTTAFSSATTFILPFARGVMCLRSSMHYEKALQPANTKPSFYW